MLTGKDTIGLLPQHPGWRMGANIQHMHGKRVCLSVGTQVHMLTVYHKRSLGLCVYLVFLLTHCIEKDHIRDA